MIHTRGYRHWFGRGGCVEDHGDAAAVFMRGELLAVYDRDDVAAETSWSAVVLQPGEVTREEAARALPVPSIELSQGSL